MKSKQIAADNQRIERITTETLVIGIDIAKEKHVAQATNFRGIVVSKRPIEFANSQSGFEYLERSIETLKKTLGMNDIIVGLESTGHYWYNLTNWLLDKGIQVVLVNPLITKRNKENRDNTPSKNDPKDALVIADAVSRGFYTPYKQKDEVFQRLRLLMTSHERWTEKSIRCKNQLIGWLDIHFPEYAKVFKEIECPRSLATLRAFPTPSDLQGFTPQQVVEGWAQQGMKRPGGIRGLCKAAELLEQARYSIGDVIGLEEGKWDLQNLLDEYDCVQKILQEVHEKIEKLLTEIPCAEQMRTMGLGPTIVGAVLSFGGNLTEFEHGNQLLRKAGLNLAERSSGNYKGKIKLSKRGSSALRKYLFLAVLNLVRGNTAFKEWHIYNVQIKLMPKMKSIMKLIGKLARILVAMARQGESFSVERALPPAA
jgi:transposase